MLYWLSSPEWVEWFSPLRLFQYITFRTLGGAGTAFVLSLVAGPPLIRALRRWKIGQVVRDDPVLALQLHRGKSGTPTMGGLLIVGSTLLSVMLWTAPGNPWVRLTLMTMVFMAAIGFWDDYLKLTRRSPRGLNGRVKLALEVAWAVALTVYVWQVPRLRTVFENIYLPFLKDPFFTGLELRAAIVWVALVLVGCANAVNLTDGLDGLAVGCTNAVFTAYAVLAYVAGHAVFARYLLIPYVPGVGELAVACGCLLGAGMGFLWFNCHPARVFMGDTGSLALGGAIAVIALSIRQELTLPIVGAVFVLEALSVMAQVLYFKLSGGKRIFYCAPIHHHFEQIAKQRAVAEGRDVEVVETMVTTRFWIVAMICAMLGLATLKIR